MILICTSTRFTGQKWGFLIPYIFMGFWCCVMSPETLQSVARTPTMVAEYVRRWVAHNRHTYSEQTQKLYQSVLWRFVKMSAPKFINDLTVEHIENHLERLLKNCSTRTANSHLHTLRSFLGWCEERYDIPNPAARIKPFRMKPCKQRVLTEEEYHKILAVCQGDEADLVRFLANTGLRVGEFRSLTWSNIDPSSPPRYLKITGKGGRQRLVPLNHTAQSILAKYKRNSNNTPIDFVKNRQGRNTILHLCYRLADRAAIVRFSPHALRHLFATQLHRKKVDLAYISKCLGHASIRVTESVYVHWKLEDVLGVTDVLDE